MHPSFANPVSILRNLRRPISPTFVVCLAGFTAVASAGCGPQFAVVPHEGLPRVSAAAPTGAALTAFANQWDSDPGDLADHVTPIAIELYNPGPGEVRVLFSDFALTDPSGARYQAINPFAPAAIGQLRKNPEHFIPRSNDGLALSLGPEFDHPILVAGRGHGGFSTGVHHGVAGFHGGAAFAGRRLHWGGVDGHLATGHFYYAHGLRGYYGPGSLYWATALIYPPYYNDWVFGWGPAYYPSARPPTDVVNLALPEGVLPAGAVVDGFLYFRKATRADARNLDLGWNLVDARTGADLGSLHVPLEVRPR